MPVTKLRRAKGNLINIPVRITVELDPSVAGLVPRPHIFIYEPLVSDHEDAVSVMAQLTKQFS